VRGIILKRKLLSTKMSKWSLGMTLLSVLFVTALFGLITIGVRQFARAQTWNPLAALEANSIANALPKKFGSVDTVEVGPLAQWGEYCGGAIFRMSSDTAREITGSGPTYFEGLSMVQQSKNGVVEKWSDWKQSPIDEEARRNGTYTPGVQCMKLSQSLNDTIYSALTNGVSYVASMKAVHHGAVVYEGAVIVIPGERLIVLTYYD
jgi:hypothetical protein